MRVTSDATWNNTAPVHSIPDSSILSPISSVARRLKSGLSRIGKRLEVGVNWQVSELLRRLASDDATVALSDIELCGSTRWSPGHRPCDTGPMHLAIAVGTPTLAIYVRDNADRFGPIGPRHRVLYAEGGVTASMVLETIDTMSLSFIEN